MAAANITKINRAVDAYLAATRRAAEALYTGVLVDHYNSRLRIAHKKAVDTCGGVRELNELLDA